MKTNFFAFILLASCPLLTHASEASSTPATVSNIASALANTLKIDATAAASTEMAALQAAALSQINANSSSASSSSTAASSSTDNPLAPANEAIAAAVIAAQGVAAAAAGVPAVVTSNALTAALEQKEEIAIEKYLSAVEAKLAEYTTKTLEPKLTAAIAQAKIDAAKEFEAEMAKIGCCGYKKQTPTPKQ